MKGKGFPRLRSKSNGDQLVKIQVQTPGKYSRKTKKIIEELNNSLDPIKKPFSKLEL
jgi:DnaJ-class molecular chaperone